ncbi:hypothetical protein WOSG25_060040 [Weissella oryzae SG25]|uniref:WxL domain-containing protein n=1 Tax=Weissella oryzae (strain DSM 25784 / JCM 18191 / LMG 30913 / SG25) TaxID=1329250 RepID=A0A069D0N8_WEIOS|nr:WxL domain-containing protein [Weissella oryzae]GAK30886.1 hypothetical protein WOSG25_060040 [Weissella oryzae SG25]
MKIATILTGSLVVSTSFAILASGSVFAATSTQVGTSNVSASLTAPKQPEDQTLTLNKVPDLDFGTKEITASALDLAQTTKVGDSKVAVSDSRGTGAGYTVTVALTGAFKDASSHTLAGSTLTLNNVDAMSADSGADIANKTSATLTDSSAQTIITAAKDQGLGNWNYTISGSNLHVLPGMYAGNYKGQLTWTLASTPKA